MGHKSLKYNNLLWRLLLLGRKEIAFSHKINPTDPPRKYIGHYSHNAPHQWSIFRKSVLTNSLELVARINMYGVLSSADTEDKKMIGNYFVYHFLIRVPQLILISGRFVIVLCVVVTWVLISYAWVKEAIKIF